VFRYKKSAATKQASAERNKPTDFNSLFAGIDTALNETQKMYNETKAKGATPDQLKPIESRINQLTWVKNNEWWLRSAAPYADKIARTVMKWVS
jgi:hypothetical protein